MTSDGIICRAITDRAGKVIMIHTANTSATSVRASVEEMKKDREEGLQEIFQDPGAAVKKMSSIRTDFQTEAGDLHHS